MMWIGVIEEWMMGDRTTDLPGAAAVSAPETAEVPATPEVASAAPDPHRTIGPVVKVGVRLVFAGGIGAAVFGIAQLNVLVAVVGLIMACTAGLTMLKFRADRLGPQDATPQAPAVG